MHACSLAFSRAVFLITDQEGRSEHMSSSTGNRVPFFRIDTGESEIAAVGEVIRSGWLPRALKMRRELGFDIAADPEDLSVRKVRLQLPLETAPVKSS